MLVLQELWSCKTRLLVQGQSSDFVEDNDEENKLFMTHFDTNDVTSDVWFVHRCSNHMSDMMEMFKECDEPQKMKVKLCDNKDMQVEGKCIVVIKTSHCKIKLLRMFVCFEFGTKLVECTTING